MKKLAVFLFLLRVTLASGQPLPAGEPAAEARQDTHIYGIQDVNAPVFNGRIFYGYPATQGHAFYPNAEWQKGSVLYDGRWYEGISFKVDIHRTELIVQHPNLSQVRLYSERVQECRFGDYRFVRHYNEKDSSLPDGLYHYITEGRLTLLALREKKIEETVGENRVIQSFVTLNHFYLLKDGRYYPVRNLKSLLDLAGDQRQPITRHLRQKGLKYRKNREQTIAEAANFYNQSFK